MIKFLFSNETDVVISKKIFEKIVGKSEKVLKVKKGEIGLTLISDKKIHELNKQYRKKDKPTDVLSFAYTEGKNMAFTKSDLLQMGDIFISIDTAKRQAEEHKHSLQKELGILFTHGVLHLFGYDHGNDKEEAEMEKWAKKILE
jgi:probable rRNA maturation factor